MDQDLKTAATRKLIVEEASLQFYQKGFRSTSVNEIMKATGLSKGAFYHNFKNKDELGVLVVKTELNTKIYQAIIAPLCAEGDAKTVLKNSLLNKFDTFNNEEKLKGCPVNNLINEVGGSQDFLNQALKDLINTWLEAVVDLITRGYKDGSIRQSTHAQQAAIFLVSSFEGIRGIRKLYSDDCTWDAYRSALENYIERL